MKSTKKFRLLILSWEYYPAYAGGLGLLVQSLVRELTKHDVECTVLLPTIPEKMVLDPHCVSVEKQVKKYLHKQSLIPDLDFDLNYFQQTSSRSRVWPRMFASSPVKKHYNLYPNNTPAITKAYAFAVADYINSNPEFDYIIGMDWLTIPAFAYLKQFNLQHKFGFYINSTEYDRNLESPEISTPAKKICDLEKTYFKQAPFLASVSSVTRNILVEKYDVAVKKIHVVDNDLEFIPDKQKFTHLSNTKNVLFIGRLSLQKGLFFLLDAAKKVVEIDPQVKCIVAGDGELLPSVVEKIAELNLEKNIILTGWVNEEEKKKLYASSSLFVMCSPSEPFGLTPLEAIRSDVPVISSQNCGFLDVVPSTPTYRYYDTETFSSMILHYLRNEHDRRALLQNQHNDLSKHSWSKEVGGFIDFLKRQNNP